jgi:enoyl-CoA hydratase/carnithine racemase
MIEIAECLSELDADPSIRTVILTGKGRAFCAGADISEFDELGILAQRRQAEAYRKLCMALYNMNTPVIAKINGIALGGGMAMVTLSHVAIAVKDAKLGTPEIKVGAFPSMVMSAILRSIPRKTAIKMILMGEMITADEACKVGFISEVVSSEELDSTTMKYAKSLASKSPSVISIGLESIRLSSDLPYQQSLIYLRDVNTIIRNTEDFREGSKAFVEKRQPEWKGL